MPIVTREQPKSPNSRMYNFIYTPLSSFMLGQNVLGSTLVSNYHYSSSSFLLSFTLRVCPELIVKLILVIDSKY
jgi:hypothetical protein